MLITKTGYLFNGIKKSEIKPFTVSSKYGKGSKQKNLRHNFCFGQNHHAGLQAQCGRHAPIIRFLWIGILGNPLLICGVLN
jgi:hypothetical protein